MWVLYTLLQIACTPLELYELVVSVGCSSFVGVAVGLRHAIIGDHGSQLRRSRTIPCFRENLSRYTIIHTSHLPLAACNVHEDEHAAMARGDIPLRVHGAGSACPPVTCTMRTWD